MFKTIIIKQVTLKDHLCHFVEHEKSCTGFANCVCPRRSDARIICKNVLYISWSGDSHEWKRFVLKIPAFSCCFVKWYEIWLHCCCQTHYFISACVRLAKQKLPTRCWNSEQSLSVRSLELRYFRYPCFFQLRPEKNRGIENIEWFSDFVGIAFRDHHTLFRFFIYFGSYVASKINASCVFILEF